jgi:hypothetical protein
MESHRQQAIDGRAALPFPQERKLLELEAISALPRPDGRTSLSDEELQRMTAEAAYFRAQRRGFQPGQELDDWLAAQKEIEALAIALT